MAREMFDPQTKEWVPPDVYYARQALRQPRGRRSSLSGPMVVRDIEPYRSVITGEMITSRSGHRAHLRHHGCVEMGNDRPKLTRTGPPKPTEADRRELRETMKAVAREKGVDVV